jgi:hypothetical protein
MQWQSAVTDPSRVDEAAARLLDALEHARPLRDINTAQGYKVRQRALGRWLLESQQDGAIGEDTVTWLHGMLLPKAA